MPYSVNVTGGTITSGSGLAAGVRVISTLGGTIDIASGVTINSLASGIAIRDGDRDGGARYSVGDGVDEIGGDVVVTTAGTIFGSSMLGIGNDTFNLTGGAITGNIYGDDMVASAVDGNDIFNWSGGSLIGNYFGNNGSDLVTVSGTANFDGTQVLDGGDDLSNADGWVDILTFRGVDVTTPGANLTNWENVLIDAARVAINDGAFSVGDGSAGSGLSVSNGGILDAGTSLNYNGNLTIMAGSFFVGSGAGAGVFRLNGNVNNAGLISTRDGAAGDSITITGDLSGAGSLSLDTVLGGSGSQTDKLTINGDHSGTIIIDVNNVGGTGAETGTGAGDGIQIVQVDGTNTGTFALSGPVIGGAFSYSLSNNGYLQSTVLSQVHVYSSIQAILQENINSMAQRTGLGRELVNSDGRASKSNSGFWLRSSYRDTNAQATTSFGSNTATNNLNFTNSFTQLGYEHKLTKMGNGYLSGGVFAQYKRFSVDIADTNNANLGSASANGYGGGASLSLNSQTGLYADLVGQITTYAVKGNSLNGNFKFDALTYSASAEAGYRIDFGGAARLVPQAQLVWRGSKLNSFSDSSGIAVNWNNKSSFTGRVGLALEGGKAISQGGNGLTGYVIANLIHDFGKSGSLSASGLNVATDLNKTRAEVRLGANLIGTNDNYALFTEFGASHSLGNQAFSSLKGTAGVKVAF